MKWKEGCRGEYELQRRVRHDMSVTVMDLYNCLRMESMRIADCVESASADPF